MKISVTSEKAQDNKVLATVTVDAKDVDKAVKRAYSDIAHKYNFQGFRHGKAPRPVIDNMLGRDAVLAQATNDILNQAEPLMLDELNIVPLGEVNYGDDPELVKEKSDYTYTATISVRPECELTSYEPVAIQMPPQEVTEAEVEYAIQDMLRYQSSLEEIDEDRAVEATDLCEVEIEDVDNASEIAGKRTVDPSMPGIPGDVRDALVGMKKGDTKEVTFELANGESATVKITLEAIKHIVTPELSDEVAVKLGCKDVAELRETLKETLKKDKERTLPELKEDRLINELASRLELEETPKDYAEQVFQEIAQDFLGRLSNQGMTLDGFLQMRGITIEQFMADMRAQADEHARQSLALDAIVRHLGLEASDEDIVEEFTELEIPNIKKAIEDFKKRGQLPAIRESIKRNKALKWLVENAQVTEVDEVAERLANKDSE